MMQIITINQWLGVLIAFTTLPPIYLLLKKYKISRIDDYLLFALFFISGFTILITDPIAGFTNKLFFYQLHHIAIDIGYLILFIHALRTIWKSPPVIYRAIGYGWFMILFILTLLWRVMEQPEIANVILFDLPHTFSSYFPLGAGLELDNGVIIYSTAFRYLGEFYRIYTLLFLLFAYVNISPLKETKVVMRAKNLWIICWLFILIHAISMFFTSITDIVSIFLLGSGIIIVYISLFIPEGVLISYIQITRLLNIYDAISNEETEKYLSIQENNEQIFTYLQTIDVEKILFNNGKD
ncbi:MAG: hypothetical protein HeimC3_21000 [Candidatus Heimdallarchaeota archaeon LC_3]|nr:MAG: hypothetical protein HeimC3_21000 [Candidatus Heimdallarchaeota archaeon LC_3]